MLLTLASFFWFLAGIAFVAAGLHAGVAGRSEWWLVLVMLIFWLISINGLVCRDHESK